MRIHRTQNRIAHQQDAGQGQRQRRSRDRTRAGGSAAGPASNRPIRRALSLQALALAKRGVGCVRESSMKMRGGRERVVPVSISRRSVGRHRTPRGACATRYKLPAPRVTPATSRQPKGAQVFGAGQQNDDAARKDVTAAARVNCCTSRCWNERWRAFASKSESERRNSNDSIIP